ncbi:SUKH-3 domain-containing protein [Streptomyces luteireticuli]|uniref:SUKH-3 domain-containing protein n=1 Tax=Streptomyces luteireticuli TaxID=173858 RepID=UPI0035560B6E
MSTIGTDALRTAGWRPGRDAGDDALLGMLTAVGTVSPHGEQAWELFPAAERALREFHGLTIAPVAPGTDVAATGCAIDPTAARFAPRTAGSFARAIGQRLFPFGRTEADTLLFLDEKGRLFAVDHGGWWLLGDSAEAGLTALVEGRAPRRIAPRSHHWQLARLPAEDELTDLVRTAMVPVYVLHRHGLLTARAARFRIIGLRGHGPVRLDEAFPLAPGSLDDSAVLLLKGVRQALDPIPLASAETSIELCNAAVGKSPRAGIGCSISTGRQGDQGINIRLTADTKTVLESGAELADATAELEAYASRRVVRAAPVS